MPSWFNPTLQHSPEKPGSGIHVDQYIAYYLISHFIKSSDIGYYLRKELQLALDDEGEISKSQLQQQCRAKLDEMKQADTHYWQWPAHVLDNLALVQQGLNLSDEEIACLFFFYAIENLPLSNAVYRDIDSSQRDYMHRMIADLFGVHPARTKKSLSHQGRLIQFGFLVETRHSGDLPYEIEDDWSGVLQRENRSFEALFDEFFYVKNGSGLCKDHYPHLEKSIDDICAWLTDYCPENPIGRNILLYGPPGTGKTELATLIAGETDHRAYTLLECTDSRMDEYKRLGKLAFGQEILHRHDSSYLIIDEIEDVIGGSLQGLFSGKKVPDKSLVNRRLESNKTPTIWISNEVGHLDPAYIRRFDLVIKVDIPPLSVRKKIVEDAAHGALSENFIHKIAEHGNISPAIISDAVNIARRIKSGEQAIEESVIRTINGKLHTVGDRISLPKPGAELPYRPDAMNTNIPLDVLAEQLHAGAEARLCLYGPPGTGKTRFAEYLSHKIHSPLIRQQASSLLSKWVGGTEENIARCFAQAESTGSILLLDEADSFLQDRSHSHAHWETTQVNELLQQMENYRGILICTTNLYGALDPASLRRFDIKVRYDYLNEEQRLRLFDDLIDTIGIESDDLQRHQVAKIEPLTPGDFAAALRAASIYQNKVTAAQLVAYLGDTSREHPSSACA